MAFILLSLFFLYALLVILLKVGWRKAIQVKNSSIEKQFTISVIVPVRNDKPGVKLLLNSLQSQCFSAYEVILVDDHSDEPINDLIDIENANVPINVLRNSGYGKKAALTTGILAAAGEIIVTTDADCFVPVEWLLHINKHFQDDKVKLVFGAVKIQHDQTFFSIVQSLEFVSLIGSGAASWALKSPTMCNGANLAFYKKVFEEVNGYEGNSHIASGDDEFLMRKILMRHPEGTSFMSDPKSIVETKASSSLKAFVKQRLRWAGKWRYNSALHTKLLAVYIFVAQLMFIACGLLVVSDSGLAKIAALLLVGRLLLELWVLFPICRFLAVRWNWLAFLILQVCYPFYVIGIAIFSQLVPNTWKGRKIA